MNRFFHFLFFIAILSSLLFVSCSKEEEVPPPPDTTLTVNLGADKTIQEDATTTLDAGNAGSTYLWSNGATTQTITVDTTGTFWVSVTNGSKTGGDTITVSLAYKLPFMETDFGTMLIWLYPQTPLHRANFINLVTTQFYDSLIFHRVVPDFVNQGGDPLGTGYGGPGYTVPAEIKSNLKHVYGALGAARLADNINPTKESNGSQFYIVNNKNGVPDLNGNYTVFGRVIDGFSAIDEIAGVPTNPVTNKPLENVYMTQVTIVYYTATELKNTFGFIIP
jgi:cyclophilin family peptidyl-prolyl cis-trans isomerase